VLIDNGIRFRPFIIVINDQLSITVNAGTVKQRFCVPDGYRQGKTGIALRRKKHFYTLAYFSFICKIVPVNRNRGVCNEQRPVPL
jgi:hypothetical protein